MKNPALLRDLWYSSLAKPLCRYFQQRLQVIQFFLGKHAGLDIKTDTQRNFQRKTTAPSWRYIQYQLGMFPILKLIGAHVKFATGNCPHPYITVAHFKLSFCKTHRLAAIAATTTLVKHQRAMYCLQIIYQIQCLTSCNYPGYHIFLVLLNKRRTSPPHVITGSSKIFKRSRACSYYS